MSRPFPMAYNQGLSPIFPVHRPRFGLPAPPTILSYLNHPPPPVRPFQAPHFYPSPQLYTAPQRFSFAPSFHQPVPNAEAQRKTTTTTTVKEECTSDRQQCRFPYKIESVEPVSPYDDKIPNKTFEVLHKVGPKSLVSEHHHIPTTFVAIDSISRSRYLSNRQTTAGYGDFLQPFTVTKLSTARSQSNSSNSNRKNLLNLVSDKQSLLVDEMMIYDNLPIVRWLFILAGILLFILGILTAFFCRPSDQYYYCRIWAAVALVVFGAVGYIHRGNYLLKWKNILFIIVGMITSAMTLACLHYLMIIFCHRTIEIFQFNNWLSYLEEIKWRMFYLNDIPPYNLTSGSDPFPGNNEKACLIMDGFSLFFDLMSFVIVVSTTLVLDKFYNSTHVITQKVSPFRNPKFFNPYGQVLVGCVQIFVGFLLQCVVYGNENFSWQKILAPVFAGAVPVIAGIVTALTLKSCGINSALWNFVAFLLEIVSIVLSIIAIILVTVGLIQNVQAFSSGTMTQTPFSRSLMIFSVFAFSATDMACLVSLFYSVALFIRLSICVFCPKKMDTQPAENYVRLDQEVENKDEKKFREIKKLILKVSPDDTAAADTEEEN